MAESLLLSLGSLGSPEAGGSRFLPIVGTLRIY